MTGRILLALVLMSATGGVVNSAADTDTEADDLMTLYALATEFDPQLQAAFDRLELGRQGVRLTRAERGPQLDASVDVAAVHQDIRATENPLYTEGSNEFVDQIFAISLAQPLYRGDLKNRVPQARAQERQVAAELIFAEQDLIYRLAEATFGFMAARDTHEFAVVERLAIERQLLETTGRMQAGLASMTDVHEARARFAWASAEEEVAAAMVEDGLLAIAEITGRVPENVATLGHSFPLVAPDELDVDAWVETALFQNSQLKSLEAAAEALQLEIRVQRSGGRMPSIGLTAELTASDIGGDKFGEGSDIFYARVGFRMRIPIYDNGRTSANVRQATAQHRIAAQGIERARRQVEAETRRSFLGVIRGISRIEALRQAVFSQEAALAAKEEGLRSGVSTGLGVLDARRDLFLARQNLAQSRYEYILSSLSLKRAAGRLSVADLRQVNAYVQ